MQASHTRDVPPHILTVDDNFLNRKKLTRAVTNLGYTTEAVSGGKAALDALKSASFDAVLLDILMPEIDGFEVLTIMKNDPELRDIPVIVISALGGETASVVKAIELGAEDFLPKDFDQIILKARLSACLTKKIFRDQEKEYYQQIKKLTQAASKLESGFFNPNRLGLDAIASQESPLGKLASVFRGMAGEIFERERKAIQTINLLKAGLMVIAFGVIGGLFPALARMASNLGTSSLGLALWISIFSAISFLGIAAFKGTLPKFSKRYLVFLMGWALIDGIMHRTTLLIASAHVEAAMLSLILALQGFIVFGLAAVLRMEKATPKRLAGLAIGLIGVLIVLGDKLETSGSSRIVWYLFAIIPALFLAIEALYLDKYKPDNIDDNATLGLAMLFTALILWPVVYIRNEITPLNWQIGQLEIIIALLVFITIAVNILCLKIIKIAGSVFYGQTAYVRTIAGMVWGMLLLNEKLSTLVWLSFIVLVLGIYLVNPKPDNKEFIIKRNFNTKKPLHD